MRSTGRPGAPRSTIWQSRPPRRCVFPAAEVRSLGWVGRYREAARALPCGRSRPRRWEHKRCDEPSYSVYDIHRRAAQWFYRYFQASTSSTYRPYPHINRVPPTAWCIAPSYRAYHICMKNCPSNRTHAGHNLGKKYPLVLPSQGTFAETTRATPAAAWGSSVTLTVIWVSILHQIWLGLCWILRWEMKHFLGIWYFATDATTKFVP